MSATLQEKTHGAEHLCVLVHGLWGNPVHLNYLRETLQSVQPEDKLHILVAKSNADFRSMFMKGKAGAPSAGEEVNET